MLTFGVKLLCGCNASDFMGFYAPIILHNEKKHEILCIGEIPNNVKAYNRKNTRHFPGSLSALRIIYHLDEFNSVLIWRAEEFVVLPCRREKI